MTVGHIARDGRIIVADVADDATMSVGVGGASDAMMGISILAGGNVGDNDDNDDDVKFVSVDFSPFETIAIIDEDGDHWQRLHEPILCPYCGMKESKCGCGWC